MQTPRMFYVDIEYTSGSGFKVNMLKGLKMLIDEIVNEDTVMVEVGCFSGVSSEMFALHCKKLSCVDQWDPYWEIRDEQTFKLAEESFDRMSLNYSNLEKVKKSSLEASKDFEDGSLDLVYIDAAHDYLSVREDILAWMPKVKTGGYLAGHDYRYALGIQVYQAVNEIFGETHKITTFPDSSFFVKL